jgi:hypothetical protein
LGTLLNEATPQMHGESGVRAGESGNKVILPNPYCPLGSILAMVVWGDQLEIYRSLTHELFESLRSFIVELL